MVAAALTVLGAADMALAIGPGAALVVRTGLAETDATPRAATEKRSKVVYEPLMATSIPFFEDSKLAHFRARFYRLQAWPNLSASEIAVH
jgi:hypothetical protein